MHRPSNKAENHYKRRTAMNIYARQGSLRPHSSQNRTRSKSNSRTPEQGRKIRKHSQRSLTVPIRKTRRRPRNLHKRKNGQRIRNRSIRPAKRTNLSNSKNKIWVPHNKKTRINFMKHARGLSLMLPILENLSIHSVPLLLTGSFLPP